MKISKTILLFVFCFGTIYLLTDAKRISSHKLKNADWYLDRKTDSAGIFSADTIYLINPYPMWKIVIGNPGDTLRDYPLFNFGVRNRNDFTLNFNNRREEYQGKIRISNREKTISFDFYEPDNNHPSDDINDWIYCSSVKYRICEFSRGHLVLCKIKN